jgi:hypothetical protein
VYFARMLMIAVGCIGLVWGLLALPTSSATDEFGSLETQLLRSETFSPSTLAAQLGRADLALLSACDTPAQIALLLAEMQLAETNLQSGAVAELDQHIRSLKERAQRALGCTPRQSMIWLVAFSINVLQGRLDDQTFALLRLSYETSPREAWIAIRRNAAAMPIVLVAPEPLRERIMSEFRELIADGFQDEASRSFLRANRTARPLLQLEIAKLSEARQKVFWDALGEARP